jgi:glycosyltransferase involved in cell wall biosynthesis
MRRAYRMLMRRGILSSATHLLAASGPAAAALFGAGWAGLRRASVVYCGVDLTPFGTGDPAADRRSARQELGIGSNEIVLGHVGGFRAAKNHSFLAYIAACAARRERRVRMLCVGSGPLEEQVWAQCKELGVRAIFAGPRDDIPRLLRAMDVFVFPSLYEGLPLSVVEAQAAGLPCLVSTEVTREVEAVPGSIRWVRLAAGARAWADAALEAAGRPPRPGGGIETMRLGPFSVESSFAQMRSIYRG